MQQGPDDGDGLLSRAEVEIELARLVLSVTRRQEAAAGESPDAEFIAWFERAAVDLVGRVAPEERPFVLSRLQQIGLSNAGLEISELEVDSSNLSFTPTEGEPPSG